MVDSVTEQEITWDFSELPTEIQQRVQVYGLGKVLQDRNSQVSADGKIDGMSKTFDSLSSGQWKAERTVGARFLPPVIEVIGKLKGCSVAAAQAAYRALSDDEKATLRDNLAEQIQEVEKARAAQDEVSLDDLI